MVPVTLVHGNNIQTYQQQYPIQKADEEDVLKFRLELGKDAKIPPIFEAVDKTDSIQVTNNKTVLGLIQSMDSNYHTVLTDMKELRDQKTNLKLKGLSSFNEESEAVRTRSSSDILGEEFVRTPEDPENKSRVNYKELLANQAENQGRAMQMLHDMTNKTISAQMFLSNVKFIGAAVSQVSQGFKTLFRSSG